MLVLFYDSDGKRVDSYNGDTVRIPLGSLEFKKRRCLIQADISTSGRRFRAARFPMQLGRKTLRRLSLPGMEGLERSVANKWLHTWTIIIGEPNELLVQVHTPDAPP